VTSQNEASLYAVAYLCEVIPSANVPWDYMRVLTFPRLLVRYSLDPDFRNSLDSIPVSESVVSSAR
jgi:hypothetical protein